jgi:hypothetical protein
MDHSEDSFGVPGKSDRVHWCRVWASARTGGLRSLGGLRMSLRLAARRSHVLLTMPVTDVSSVPRSRTLAEV